MPKKSTRAIAIKTRLLETGIRQNDIANALKVRPSAISMFISGQRTSRRFDAWVEKNLNLRRAA